MLSIGLRVILGVAPAAIVTSMVSPIALDIAIMKAAIIPDSAAGTTILRLTSNLVAPRAYAPSLSVRGTEIIASSLKEETMGMIITPMTRPALRALKIKRSSKITWRLGVTKVKAK